MSSNLVIVAIPAEDELVNKVSSEKVPHLTLLFLGEVSVANNVDQMALFVEHALSISEHGPFYLDVDYRGTLGPDAADVLFFNNGWDSKWIKSLRGQLLQEPNIRKAYDSVTGQYPEWLPHLTLGYPITPANPIPDNRTISCVRFDRIAIWTGNYEGPEFRLKWPDQEEEMAVAYGEIGQVAVEELLHFGKKGMKWGVRNAIKRVSIGIQDANFESHAGEKQAAREHIVSTANKTFREKDLSRINSKPEYQSAKKLKTRLRNPKDPIVKQYRSETKQAYIKQLESTANSMTNASKTRQYTIRERGIDLPAQGGNLPTSKRFWDVSTRAIAHGGDSFTGVTSVELIMDADGFIIDLKPEIVQNNLAQSATLGEQYILEHFGTKGMKWGQRNKRAMPVAVAPYAVSKVPPGDKRKTKIETQGGQNHPAHADAIKVAEARIKLHKSGPSALSNKELQDVVSRVELENRVKLAVQPKGKKFVSKLLSNQGNQGANQFVNKQVRKKLALG